MTRRDIAWRVGGIALIVAAAALRGLAPAETSGSLPGLIAFLLAITGIVLLFQGKRVPVALLAERRRLRAEALVLPQSRQRRATSNAARARLSTSTLSD